VPRFYFDTRKGGNLLRDDEGLEFLTANAARADASRALGEMIKDAMPDGDHLDMAVEVRGDNKRPLFKVQITFDVQSPDAVPLKSDQLKR
jgi:hypothetical protein